MKSVLLRLTYILASFVLFLLITYIIFTWKQVKG